MALVTHNITIDVFIKNARACQLPYLINALHVMEVTTHTARLLLQLVMGDHQHGLVYTLTSDVCMMPINAGCVYASQNLIANGNTMEFTCLHNCG